MEFYSLEIQVEIIIEFHSLETRVEMIVDVQWYRYLYRDDVEYLYVEKLVDTLVVRIKDIMYTAALMSL